MKYSESVRIAGGVSQILAAFILFAACYQGQADSRIVEINEPPEEIVSFTLNLDSAAGGSAAVSPARESFGKNELLRIYAVPEAGWHFVAWDGTKETGSNPYVFRINENEWIIPVFERDGAPEVAEVFSIRADAAPGGGISLEPAQEGFGPGDLVCVTARPAEGYSFIQWTGTVSSPSNPLVFAVDGNEWLIPVFKAEEIPAPPQLFSVKTSERSGGAVLVSPVKDSYGVNEQVMLTAEPGSGYSFAKWSGTESGSENPLILTVTGDEWIIPVFTADSPPPEPVAFTLRVDEAAGGAVTVTPQKDTYAPGEQVRISATPEAGYVFAEWRGTEGGTANPKILTVTGDEWIIPAFNPVETEAEPEPVLYSVRVDPTTKGTVSVSPEKAAYGPGEQVRIAVEPGAGYSFAKWSGTESGNENPLILTVSGDEWIIPVFAPAAPVPEPVAYTLRVDDAAGGAVTVTPQKEAYTPGEQVRIAATPADGHVFTGWRGTESGTENPKILTVTGNEWIIPAFNPVETEAEPEPVLYSVRVDPTAKGTVSVSPEKAAYGPGEQVRIAVEPGPGYSFAKWSGTESGSENPLILTVTGDEWIIPVFAADVPPPEPVAFTLRVDEAAGGAVTVDPIKGAYSEGEYVRIAAVPNSGYLFTGWTGTVYGSQNPMVIKITADAWIIPVFKAEQTYQIITERDPVGGRVVLNPDRTSGFRYGDQCTLTAVPNEGYQFDGWTGDFTGLQKNLFLAFTRDYQVQANFSVIPVQRTFTLSIAPPDNGAISIAPNKGEYYENEIVRVTAVPDPGYMLSSWSGTDSPSGQACFDLVMTGDKAISAAFMRRGWTHLVYMAADNNLDSQALNDLNEMEHAITEGKAMSILALVDRKAGNGDWSDTRLYEIAQDPAGNSAGLVSRRLDATELGLSSNAAGELNLSDPVNLVRFLAFAKRVYAADNYSLTVWGHGTGWRGGEGSSSDGVVPMKAVAMDETSNGFMSIAELGDALSGANIAVLGFDTCFGSLIEVAYELRDCGTNLVASEGPTKETGWDYESLFTGISGGSAPGAVCSRIVGQFAASYSAVGNATISVVNLSGASSLFNAFDSWASVVASLVDTASERNALRGALFDPAQVDAFFLNDTDSDYYVDIHSMLTLVHSLVSAGTLAGDRANELASGETAVFSALNSAITSGWSMRYGTGRRQIGVHVIGVNAVKIPLPAHSASYVRGSGGASSEFVENAVHWVPHVDPEAASVLNRVFYSAF